MGLRTAIKLKSNETNRDVSDLREKCASNSCKYNQGSIVMNNNYEDEDKDIIHGQCGKWKQVMLTSSGTTNPIRPQRKNKTIKILVKTKFTKWAV